MSELDKSQRRELGAHYTSEENILKLINPLFMDDLWREFGRVKTDLPALLRFHDKIARLKFLDPACGCGNFLIVTYRELRLLELEILKARLDSGHSGRKVPDVSPLLKVSAEQFYGIEYEDFPCHIAQAAMRLVDHQMDMRVLEQFGSDCARLPLTQSATIVRGNALRIGWESVVPKEELSYIMGNPPFAGKKEQSRAQKAELADTFANQRRVGILDYVAAWYKKAAQMTSGTAIRVAFVSTNSISQGEQPAVLWKTLLDTVKIDFAHRTFRWSDETRGRAAVHCVIIGFSPHSVKSDRIIFDKTEKTRAANISPYLVDAPNVLIESRAVPLCPVPKIVYGSMPIDNGALILSKEEREALIKTEPQSEKFVRRYVGGDELINGTIRYCLWLKDFSPHELMASKFVAKRIELCRKFREKSDRPQTRALADTPHLFGEIRQPEAPMLVIPKVSSDNRRYLPIGFLSPEVVVSGSALIIPSAAPYHFGVLSSSMHNAWMRTVGGRMKSDYQYSNTLVYNNFPWPGATDEQESAIGKLAQAVSDARALYPDSSLADLYDPPAMPPELLKAHQNLDRAVMKLYGFSVKDTTEASRVAALMERYQTLCRQKKG